MSHVNLDINQYIHKILKVNQYHIWLVNVKKYHTVMSLTGLTIVHNVNKTMYGTMISLKEYNMINVYSILKTLIVYQPIKRDVIYVKKVIILISTITVNRLRFIIVMILNLVLLYKRNIIQRCIICMIITMDANCVNKIILYFKTKSKIIIYVYSLIILVRVL